MKNVFYNAQKNKSAIKKISLEDITKDKQELVLNTATHHYNLDDTIKFFSVKEDDYSNMIDIWNLLPRFHLTNEQIEQIESEWLTICDTKYKITLRPVPMKNTQKSINGLIRVKYPGMREMYVEEALTKMATTNFLENIEGKEIELTDLSKRYLISVKFTLNGLQRELRRFGHTYSINQIKEALMILNEATLYIKAETIDPKNPLKKIFYEYRGAIISQLELVDYDSYLNSNNSMSRVVFHELKTLTIMNIAFRKYNYSKSMRLTSYLSKYLFNRLILNWRQASTYDYYSIRMSTVLQDSCHKRSKSIYNDIRAIRKAFNQLIAQEILLDCKEERIKKNNRTIDILFTLCPHPDFIRDTVKANSTQKSLQLASNQKKEEDKEEKLILERASKENALSHIQNIKKILTRNKL